MGIGGVGVGIEKMGDGDGRGMIEGGYGWLKKGMMVGIVFG